ncbi:MAG TPA: RsmE family RNA methyltransferase [Vicinamibacterales bacterium]|nr:RsmE family RNA methyltransferase [Vicinamibacterales bacterium]
MHRFFAPDCGASGGLVTLSPDEGAHLTRVLRLRPGDRVVLVDGRGGSWTATIDAVHPDVRARIHESIAPAPEPRVRVTLASAVLKGEGFDQVVRDAVMLGVSAIQPVISTRTVRTHGAAGAPAPTTDDLSHTGAVRGRRADRWTRIAIASMKQCGRAVLPEVATPTDLPTLLAAARQGARLMLVEPQAGGADRVPLAALDARPVPGAATLLVGPEGGWTTEEVAAARAAGWTLLTLGGRTLRAEAAPLVALAGLWTVWKEF